MSKQIKTTRRLFVKGMTGSAVLLSAPAIWTGAARAQDNRLIVGGSGGAIDDAYTQAYYKPYFEETGVEVIPVERRENPLAEVRAVVETQTYKWDFCEGIAHDVAATLAEDGYLEPLDLTGPAEEVMPSMKSETFVSGTSAAFILAYNSKHFDKKMTYADFWDVEGHPGRRGLRQSARETVSIALVADGVPPEEVSTVLQEEAGWERAFAKLDEIRDDIDVWWASSAQTPTLLQTGEVDLITTFNGRAQNVIDAGAPVAITWDGSFYNNYGWVIPSGSPKADQIRDFIKFCCRADRQAAAAEIYGTGPSNPNAIALVDPERAKVLPTHPDNIRNMALLDFGFWGPRQEEATMRFNEWLQG
ncbi:extracellular solute-binding protein [Tropicimonas sp. IMCC34011]|uniref:extracellular solute-binding protein n=1 Tax=Tropicimonas sp. IMCC34011 TaxID=2248759 RepID=UPI000E2877C1|nr:extracellular solute-binding protein [Tropicimonas sp. IMCC34011]